MLSPLIWHQTINSAILRPSFKVVPNSQGKVRITKYVLIGLAIRPLLQSQSHLIFTLHSHLIDLNKHSVSKIITIRCIVWARAEERVHWWIEIQNFLHRFLQWCMKESQHRCFQWSGTKKFSNFSTEDQKRSQPASNHCPSPPCLPPNYTANPIRSTDDYSIRKS